VAKQLFANNASALLAASINDTDLTIQVTSGFGQFFPLPGASEYFLLTIENEDGDIEIVKVTSRTTDLLTIPSGGRGQEGTTAQSWTNGVTRVELRQTKGTLEAFLQRGGDTMDGDLGMQNHNISNARLTGTWRGTGGQLVGTAIRGVLDDDSNEIFVPNDGTRATAGGDKLLTETDDVSAQVYSVGMIMDWYGASVNVPDGWHICDGTNGTPDLRGKFVRGVDGSFALGDTGGAATGGGTTDAAANHTHAASAAAVALDSSQMPSHNHRLYVVTDGDSDANVIGFGAQAGVAVGGMDITSDGAGGFANTNGAGQKLIEDVAGGGGTHTHGITVDAGGAHSHAVSGVATIPPFMALYKIMYVG
jgi:microcystin-dependent protein